MEKKDLVKMINDILRSPWNGEDVKHGKSIQCMPAWTFLLKEIVPLYSDKGWIIQKQVAISSRGRQLSLNFKHPEWHQKIN